MIKLSLQPFAPEGWLLCDGSLLAINDFPELYAVMGKRFGGDELHFALPDMRGEQAHHLIKAQPAAGDATYQGLVSQMVLWAGDEIPENWFPCDGRPVIGADYPILQKVAAQGMPGGLPEAFNLPLSESKPGLRFIICMDGLDPMVAMGPPATQNDDDDY
ncbi:MAG TPA: tail fiber protein [Bacteroidia bacterium]|nr:tail fiber protein [Bacteroidia bacterium]